MTYFKFLGAMVALVLIVSIVSPVSADDPFGGPASGSSGDGTTTWGAIYIAEGCSSSIAFPAGSARWFKADAWDDYKLQIWLDDDPQWGAASKYFENYPDPARSDLSYNTVNGFWLRVYAPDSLDPNYFYDDQQPRADLLTTRDGIRPDGSEVNWVGMANNNKFIPSHLLWYEARFNGWVYVRVENRMPWNGNAIVCTHREYSPRPRPPAPPSDDSGEPQKCDDGPECHMSPGQARQ